MRPVSVMGRHQGIEIIQRSRQESAIRSTILSRLCIIKFRRTHERYAGFKKSLITSKVSDARRRGATTEAYEAIRRKEERALARLRREGNAADDALMVDQGELILLTIPNRSSIFPGNPLNRFRLIHQEGIL